VRPCERSGCNKAQVTAGTSSVLASSEQAMCRTAESKLRRTAYCYLRIAPSLVLPTAPNYLRLLPPNCLSRAGRESLGHHPITQALHASQTAWRSRLEIGQAGNRYFRKSGAKAKLTVQIYPAPRPLLPGFARAGLHSCTVPKAASLSKRLGPSACPECHAPPQMPKSCSCLHACLVGVLVVARQINVAMAGAS
jgi:hypothetical protein